MLWHMSAPEPFIWLSLGSDEMPKSITWYFESQTHRGCQPRMRLLKVQKPKAVTRVQFCLRDFFSETCSRAADVLGFALMMPLVVALYLMVPSTNHIVHFPAQCDVGG